MLSRHGNCMRQLSVENTMSPVGMPAAVTARVLSSQCSSLETLSIEALTAGLSGAEFGALASLTRLRDLEVRGRVAMRRTCCRCGTVRSLVSSRLEQDISSSAWLCPPDPY